MRQTQLRQTAIARGTSVGMLNARQSGTSTPMSSDTAPSVRELTNEQMDIMSMELQRYAQMQEERLRQSGARASTHLDEAHRQSLPVGVMDNDDDEDMPSLVDIEEGGEEEETDDDPELIPDGEQSTQVPPVSRKHKETIDYSTKMTKWQNKSVQEEDIRFQLFLRGIELTPEQEEEIAKLKVKGKGRNQTRKDYLINYVDRLIQTGKWTDQVNDQLLQKRMVEWREMKKGKGKGSASSSSGVDTLKDIAISGAKAGVETLAKAGATAIAKSFLPV